MDNAFPDSAKAQSAMEYLTTYGWAILIIAIVLGALFELGVFSGYYFTPKIAPGSCIVSRPYGAHSLQGIGLEGDCGVGIPEYTFSSNYKGTSGSGYIEIPYNASSSLRVYNFTISLWLDEYSPAPDIGCCSGEFALFSEPDRIYIYRDWQPAYTTRVTGYVYNSSISTDPTLPNVAVNYCGNYTINVGTYTWNYWAFTYNGTNLTGYVNGKEFCTLKIRGVINPLVTGNYIYVGVINGSEANLQIYNAALSGNYIYAEYLQGIGGAPINLNKLVAWYPLNGNANDYSGNGENGNAISGIFSNAWESGYTQP